VSASTRKRGEIRYDDQVGHVCTCTEATMYDDNGYPSHSSYLPTVEADKDVAPTESGSWYYVCARCGAGDWSGC
jgi:hypothetical protein